MISLSYACGALLTMGPPLLPALVLISRWPQSQAIMSMRRPATSRIHQSYETCGVHRAEVVKEE